MSMTSLLPPLPLLNGLKAEATGQGSGISDSGSGQMQRPGHSRHRMSQRVRQELMGQARGKVEVGERSGSQASTGD